MTGASLARASKTLDCLRDNHGSVPWAQPDQITLLIEKSLIFSHRRVLGAQGHPDRRTRTFQSDMPAAPSTRERRKLSRKVGYLIVHLLEPN